MSNLSDAAKLYLTDYKILKIVNNELDKFLNEIVDKVYQNVNLGLIEPNKSKYKSLWIWKNQTTNGLFEVGFLDDFENRDFKVAKIHIKYRDVRNLDKYDNTNIVEIETVINSSHKPFERELRKLNNSLLEQKVVELDLDNSENTTNMICEFITEKFYQIEKIFETLKDVK